MPLIQDNQNPLISALQKPEMDVNLIIVSYATLSLHHHYMPLLIVDELQGGEHVLPVWDQISNVIAIEHHIL
jgi:hypothetical protein